ncbi:MAG: PIG-L family deacetylase [Ruminococcus sp.]|nr:PIG-L family deacetylase [Ruminococcus sp.]
MKDERYLIVVAHPDDELLGCGATISKLKRKGCYVAICVLSCESSTRTDDIFHTMLKTHEALGVDKTLTASFGCMRFKDEDHHTMVKFIEKAIKKTKPTTIITHHPCDLHNDHYITSIVCQEAARLPQRQIGYEKTLKRIMFMEVPSETDFALNHAWGKFTPNYYIGVKKSDVKKKIDLLKEYDYVVRKAPHPRSEDNINALPIVRGAESGLKRAEAFQIVFEIGEADEKD